MNSYISNFRFKKYYFVFLLFYALFSLNFFIFILKPELFYWRAWEYYNEIAHRIPGGRYWIGEEAGDMTRSFIFAGSKTRLTKVTADIEGFRSVPFVSESYPVIFNGDSNTWGSCLSDEETIPWQVASYLNTPVFNATRTDKDFSYSIKNPRFKNSKIIVELFVQANVYAHVFDAPFIPKDFEKPIKSYRAFSDVHPKRYMILLKWLNKLDFTHLFHEIRKLLFLDSRLMVKNRAYSYGLSEESLNQIAEGISRRAEVLERMGFKYVFSIVPARDLQLSPIIDPNEIEQEKLLSRKLGERGIRYIDLCEVFRKDPDPKNLFFPNDTHVNPSGAKLIAHTVAAYLKENFPAEINCAATK